MKFRIERKPGLPGSPPSIKLLRWAEYADSEEDDVYGGYWEEFTINFSSIESAKQYAQQYKNNIYEEEFEL